MDDTILRSIITAILLRDDKVLLAKRKNTGIKDGLWSLPMGHIEENEREEDALKRECQEELGIAVTRFRLLKQMTDHLQKVRNSVFLVEDYCGEPINKEPEKCEKVAWFRLRELPEEINPVTLLMLQTCVHEKI